MIPKTVEADTHAKMEMLYALPMSSIITCSHRSENWLRLQLSKNSSKTIHANVEIDGHVPTHKIHVTHADGKKEVLDILEMHYCWECGVPLNDREMWRQQCIRCFAAEDGPY